MLLPMRAFFNRYSSYIKAKADLPGLEGFEVVLKVAIDAKARNGFRRVRVGARRLRLNIAA